MTSITSSSLDERHLEVELGELGLAVGAQVLVAEAAGDLVVALVAGHHQQLLEELRRLRQRVEVARAHAAGDEEVARALGRGAREDRRLDLEEVVRRRGSRGSRARPCGAAASRRACRLAAQVEHAVAQAQHLVDRAVLVDRERRRGRLGEQRRRRATSSSISPVGRFGLTLPASRAHDRAGAPRRRARRAAARRARAPRRADSGWKTSWTMPGAVAQVDEDQPAVVAAAVHPAGDAHGLAPARRPQLAAPGVAVARWPRGGLTSGPCADAAVHRPCRGSTVLLLARLHVLERRALVAEDGNVAGAGAVGLLELALERAAGELESGRAAPRGARRPRAGRPRRGARRPA